MENNTSSKKLKTIDLIYIGLSVSIITVMSWMTIPIGSVPFTLQTMAVCLVSAFFGAKRGCLSVVIYILMGCIGVPVFSSFKSGIGVIAGPTGGYLVGFIFTSIIVGFVCEKWSDKVVAVASVMIVGIAVCYAFGTCWFYIYMKTKEAVTLGYVLGICVVPFILPDIAKVIVATFLVKRLKKYVK